MKNTLSFIFALLLATSALASDLKTESVASNTEAEQQTACAQLKESGATPELLAGSGCCSWHGGQCGCSGGRVTCCDGATSPSCTCSKEDPIVITN